MVSFISSYLFGNEPILLNRIRWHDANRTEEYWTLQDVPGPRFADKPIYILTSTETISGGEAFTYNLKMLARATLVGETTNGSAHIGASYCLHPNFEAFIPIGYPINPVSKRNWEGVGVGVDPDVRIHQEQALSTAYRLALEAIIASLKPLSSEKNEIQLAEAINALKKLILNDFSSRNSPNENL